MPQSLQNFRPSGFSKPQLGQRMGVLPRRLGSRLACVAREAPAHTARGGGSLRCHYPSQDGVSREIKDALEMQGKAEGRHITGGVLPMVHRRAHEGRRHRHGSGSHLPRQVSVTPENFPCVRASRVTSAKPQATAAVTSPWCTVHDSFADMTLPTNAARTWRSTTPARLYLYDTILGWQSHHYHCQCAWRWRSRNYGDRVGR